MDRSAGCRTSLAVLVAVNILNFYDRQVIGALTEPIRKEFGLSDGQIGLIGSAFIWLYALVGLPLGRVADTWSRRKLLAGGMLVWSALTGLAAVAVNYAMLLVSRLGFAVGEAVVAPAATSWIGDLFPAAERSRASGAVHAGRAGGRRAEFFLQRSAGPGLRMARGDGPGRGAGRGAGSAPAAPRRAAPRGRRGPPRKPPGELPRGPFCASRPCGGSSRPARC